MKDEFKRKSSQGLGPGGYKCRCCGPNPKDRPAHRRKARARLAEEDRKDLMSEEMAPLDLTKVAEALEAYDEKRDEFSRCCLEWAWKDCASKEDAVNALGQKVKEAFAEATKDRNSHENAMLINLGRKESHSPTWIRRMLQRDGLYSGIREETTDDGE
jgi:hypothetical protein